MNHIPCLYKQPQKTMEMQNHFLFHQKQWRWWWWWRRRNESTHQSWSEKSLLFGWWKWEWWSSKTLLSTTRSSKQNHIQAYKQWNFFHLEVLEYLCFLCVHMYISTHADIWQQWITLINMQSDLYVLVFIYMQLDQRVCIYTHTDIRQQWTTICFHMC